MDIDRSRRRGIGPVGLAVWAIAAALAAREGV
jgi:hypothetical protein